MKRELHEIPIREVVKNYRDNDEEGVVGYDGKLIIRPEYQREFLYDKKERGEVIDTVRRNLDIGLMYWAKNINDKFGLMDGQQRILSICQYIAGDFSIVIDKIPYVFDNLTIEQQEQILDYKLLIRFFEGNESDIKDQIKRTNTHGEPFNKQEILNISYCGSWLTAAKKIFSKTGCPAYLLGGDYINGSPIRQDYLETSIKWISNGDIENYMSLHQHNPEAEELWAYFKDVIEWVKHTFTTRRNEMKDVNWGELYNRFKNEPLDPIELEQNIQTLMMDDDVTKKSGIYEYVLTRNERCLNIRKFTDNQKREAYERQRGICPMCGKHFELEEMEGDHHIIPWHEGGKTTAENCKMLCKPCNRIKSGK